MKVTKLSPAQQLELWILAYSDQSAKGQNNRSWWLRSAGIAGINPGVKTIATAKSLLKRELIERDPDSTWSYRLTDAGRAWIVEQIETAHAEAREMNDTCSRHGHPRLPSCPDCDIAEDVQPTEAEIVKPATNPKPLSERMEAAMWHAYCAPALTGFWPKFPWTLARVASVRTGTWVALMDRGLVTESRRLADVPGAPLGHELTDAGRTWCDRQIVNARRLADLEARDRQFRAMTARHAGHDHVAMGHRSDVECDHAEAKWANGQTATYRVEIQASDAYGAIWQAMTSEDVAYVGTPRELAMDVAQNQNVADGAHWRVAVYVAGNFAGPIATAGPADFDVVTVADERRGREQVENWLMRHGKNWNDGRSQTEAECVLTDYAIALTENVRRALDAGDLRDHDRALRARTRSWSEYGSGGSYRNRDHEPALVENVRRTIEACANAVERDPSPAGLHALRSNVDRACRALMRARQSGKIDQFLIDVDHADAEVVRAWTDERPAERRYGLSQINAREFDDLVFWIRDNIAGWGASPFVNPVASLV